MQFPSKKTCVNEYKGCAINSLLPLVKIAIKKERDINR